MNAPVHTPIKGRVALVTGAARGLGRGIALRLGRHGADVVVNYHTSRQDADATVAALHGLGRRSFAFQADVADPDAVAAMVAETASRLGPCDILVANAGIIEQASIFDLAPERWERMLAVVLKGTFLCAKAVIPAMRQSGGGRIVTISSDAAKRGGFATGPHYGAAKAGVLGLMRGLARQLAPLNITVNDVCPVDIPVERWAGRSPERIEAIRRNIPLGRFGSPDDVGAAVAFLVSPDAQHITGISLDVSGGAMLT